ncbi:MAG: response regulator [Fuerstiella sp.]|nr:response regulator [Fuerstiella sp.]MCP4856380.1 response regulator [Fuerstiella sp.]
MTSDQDFRVLLVEDDQALGAMMRDYLMDEGFEVMIETRGDTAVNRILREAADAVILDVNLPGLDGISVCRTVRRSYSGPILILTARGDDLDEIVGLEVGADDYMRKPIKPRMLLARLRAHLRQSTVIGEQNSPAQISVGGLTIDSRQRSFQLDGQPISLTTAEFDLMWLLASNVGQVLSRDHIYQTLNGFKYDGLDRSIDLRVSRLRKRIGDDPTNPQRIKSIRGVGYLLVSDS